MYLTFNVNIPHPLPPLTTTITILKVVECKNKAYCRGGIPIPVTITLPVEIVILDSIIITTMCMRECLFNHVHLSFIVAIWML